MAQPFNYMLNVPDPTQSVMGGVQNALNISNMMSQRNLAEQKALDLQKARETQVQMETDLGTLSQNPTPSALASMMVKYPSLSEHFKRTYDVLSTEQKDSRLGQATQVYAALQSGKPEIAQQLLTEQATAYRNSGQEREAKTLEDLGVLIKTSPETAKTSTGLFLASAMGPDKFTETFTKLQGEQRDAELQPSKLTESQAKAQSAAVAAKFAESNAALDIQKKGWDITKIQEDIKIAKQNAGIAALNAQISREGNDLKRRELQLKVQEMAQKRDEAVRGKVAEASTAAAQADNLLNTVEKALNMSVTGRDKAGRPTGFTGTITSATGPISSRMPTLRQDVADFEEMINTLGSQITMSRIGEMKGALSDKDLATLQSSLQSLSLRQSPRQLVNNLLEVQRLTQKARKNTMVKFGAPRTLSVPDTPAAQPSPAEIAALVKKYGGGR